MITCNLMGGLGNQLFQIFATIAYAFKCKETFYFMKTDFLGGIGKTIKRNTYWDNFLIQLKPYLIREQNMHLLSNVELMREKNLDKMPDMIREKGFTFENLPIKINPTKNTLLFGYFQSYKYFQEYDLDIMDLINLSSFKKEVLKLVSMDKNMLSNTVSLHFRIGDYINIQNYHPIMKYEYYKDSLDALLKIRKLKNGEQTTDLNVLYFYEEEDIDMVMDIINKLKINFPEFTFISVPEKLEDWQQLILMSCCKYNVIANSSFSWWAAYFNSNHEKEVFYPSTWFGKDVNNNTSDLCPLEWNKIIVI